MQGPRVGSEDRSGQPVLDRGDGEAGRAPPGGGGAVPHRSSVGRAVQLLDDLTHELAHGVLADHRADGESAHWGDPRWIACGRCEVCEGGGMKVIEMNFLPDVYVQCEKCMGKRYNRETLEVRYRGKSISDVLDMTVEEAVPFFEAIPKIYRMVKTLLDVGLGYITLGQQATTLSGGEAQRVKLASELHKKDTGNTVYILDEPTTGLHFEDVRVLLLVLNKLVDKGNTVIVIEHHTDMLKAADYLIDMGPEGGKRGGTVVAVGTPAQVKASGLGHTGRFL